MLFDLPQKGGPIELGPANRKGVVSYLTAFGHQVTWMIQHEGKGLQKLSTGDINIFATPYICILKDTSRIGKIINRILNAPIRACFIIKLFREGSYNILYIKGNMVDELVAIYIKARYKVPLVVDSEPPGMHRDTYRVGTKRVFWASLIGRWHSLVTMYVMEKADLITPSSKWFGDMLFRAGIPEDKLMPYPNGVDIAKISNKNGAAIRKDYNLNDSKVIIYVGAMDKARNLSVLIQTFSRVAVSYKEVMLLMVGEGNDRINLQQLALSLSIQDRVVFTGYIEGSRIPDFISAADIGISPIPPLDCYQIGSPVKLFEYMGSAKPVVANEEIFDQNEVLIQSGGGITVHFDADAFANALIYLLNNPQEATAIGKKGQEWIINNRTYEILARQLEKRYLALINSS
jgi:glycosyltransferase involved in cell wall biosynthesis